MAMEGGEAKEELPSTVTVPQTRRRRPFCDRCVKPATVCLCSRLKSPPIDNPIGVTILQHSLEGKHPLNTARVASIGLKNIAVVSVSDVLFQADFSIRPLGIERPDLISNASALIDSRSGHDPAVQRSDGGEKICQEFASFRDSKTTGEEVCAATEADLYRITCSPRNVQISLKRTARPDISWAMSNPVLKSAALHGFTVKKLQTKGKNGIMNHGSFEEFHLLIAPRSALLFPGKAAVDLEAIDFDVKHLFLLDATWDKARRMFYENPWLQLLPRIKLPAKAESLYKEVRHQPRAGCLSTIESIVCALKCLSGDAIDGLDELLEVFESMVEDQRRLKEEKVRRIADVNDSNGAGFQK
ncbi:DTW domain-containing protein [Wolffia australiana]